jgi:hypothetical protein
MDSTLTDYVWPDDPAEMTLLQKKVRGHNHPLIVLTRNDPAKARAEWLKLFERFAGNRVAVGKHLGLARDTVYYRVCRLNLWPEIRAIRERTAQLYGYRASLFYAECIQRNVNKDPRRTFLGTTERRRFY